MTKKIAVINDLSGFGRCSLTATLSVLPVMGLQACPLPTAVLTAQTGYPSYYCDNYTDKMDHFLNEWNKLSVSFAGIYTGFIADPRQFDKIDRFLELFQHDDNFLLADPVMGDNGRTYDIYSDTLLLKMRRLIRKADITTPNLTELCLLTETDYHTLPPADDMTARLREITRLARLLCETGTGTVVVTGIHFHDSDRQENFIGNLCITAESSRLAAFADLGGSYSGTGDLFASILAGGIARGQTAHTCAELAGKFLELAIAASAAKQVPPIEGVDYEPYLYMLLPERPSGGVYEY